MASYADSQGEGPSLRYLPIPDMLAGWPWQRRINPLYEEVAAEGNAWVRSFSPFNTKSQHAFERCDFALLTSLIFPDAPHDQLRIAVDLMNIFFLVDEYTDVESSPVVREIIDVCIDALRSPSKLRPDGEVILGEIVREFWERGHKRLHPTGEPFVASLVDYLNAVADQAEARDRGGFLPVDEFLSIRREDVGVRLLYVLGALFLSVSDRFHHHPALARLTRLGCDLVIIENQYQDMISYNREQASGNSEFNIATLTMHHNALSLHDAARSLISEDAELAAQYLQCHSELLALHGESGSVQRYLDHMGNIRRGIWCWSFECGRYFGDRGATFATTHEVPLIPKKIRDKDLRGNRVDVFLMEDELAKL